MGVRLNKVASHIVATYRAPKNRAHTIKVKRELKAKATETEHSRPFSTKKVLKAPDDVTAGKSPGFDNIHPEFLVNCASTLNAG